MKITNLPLVSFSNSNLSSIIISIKLNGCYIGYFWCQHVIILLYLFKNIIEWNSSVALNSTMQGRSYKD